MYRDNIQRLAAIVEQREAMAVKKRTNAARNPSRHGFVTRCFKPEKRPRRV
ncbi:hypothetical protein [Burkholderia sp. Nafp2/4-1b]|uniref:hypothetical protein n=1 Tax=Burkholderia sp. Nafp2/4-1b TaxID=2116686 RepID=UPI0013CE6267|nr:hypothetical protein [Burkholderia sp. Nafp2/4-1b]